ncbi:hypothetical protein VPHD480_0435 [Vibrio phage D480]|nr:hypothetical protein MYOV011v1_p0203 [Vibrio phage 6E35.1a]
MAIIAGDLKFKRSLHTVAASVGNGNTHDSEVDSLGGGVSAVELVSNQLHDLFDAVPSAESAAGRVEYRCFYVQNEHASLTLYDSKVFISNNTASVDSLIEIALDPVAVNGEDSSILLDDETDSGSHLTALTFVDAPSFESGLDIGNLAAGEQRAIWIKRTINAGAAAAAEDATIAIRGDTDA